jgi:hypothetical protein
MTFYLTYFSFRTQGLHAGVFKALRLLPTALRVRFNRRVISESGPVPIHRSSWRVQPSRTDGSGLLAGLGLILLRLRLKDRRHRGIVLGQGQTVRLLHCG